MTRITQLVSSSAQRSGGFQKLMGAALIAAAAAAVPAHADAIIGFEGPVDYNGQTAGGDVYSEAGYSTYFFANVPGGGIGTATGQFFNNNYGTCDTASMACPVGHAGTYYGALNDSYIDLVNDEGLGFHVRSFDAAFIGGSPTLSSYPAIPALLRLQGITAAGTSLTQDFQLGGATAAGFTFGHFNTTGTFASTQFVELLAFGLVCNSTGSSCTAFNSNRAQFGIDNINVVPEPGTFAMVGLGLMGLAGALRRRKS
jgi:hypothetical protein